MLWLAVSELQLYRSTEIVNNLLVDAAQTEQVQAATSEVLAFSIALYSQRCDTLRYYLRDSKGNMLDIGSNAVRTSSWVPPELLAADPNYKPTREEAPGCRLDATIPIPKVILIHHILMCMRVVLWQAVCAQVAAEFKLLPKDFEPQQQQMQQFVNIPQFNSSHKIISLRFGPPIPDQAFPLDDVIKTAESKPCLLILWHCVSLHLPLPSPQNLPPSTITFSWYPPSTCSCQV